MLHLEHPERLDLLDAPSRDLMENELLPALLRYSTTLIRLLDGKLDTHCSGTLVEFGGRHFVLTAGHCASELNRCREIGLCLVLDNQSSNKHHFEFPRTGPAVVIYEVKNRQWGPDLALIPIPESRVGALTAYSLNSFYNLEKHQRTMLKAAANLRRGFWAFLGVPVLTSKREGSRPTFGMTLNWSPVSNLRARTKGQFDYLDVIIPETAVNLPKHFQGVSGGGLFRIDIEESEGGKLRMGGPPVLEGVAFYESPENQERFVRFHGRRSIYKYLLSAIATSPS